MYNNDQKALLILSQECSLKKRMSLYNSVESPSMLYDDLSQADEIIEGMKKYRVRAVTIVDEEYPKELKDIYDAPIVLFCRGDIKLLNEQYLCAVVGTRKATRYGKDIVTKFVRELVANNVVIVSGLARGIDACAHKECLENNGKTIAVVANGLDMVYPSENLELAEKIVVTCLMVSEYPIGVAPMAYRFPERNRIISGLSKAVLIPEAGLNSGSLITANCAVEQGKELFVVPGSIFASQSEGCNQKLKELQAAIATCPEDILGAVGISAIEKEQLIVQLTLEQQQIAEILKDEEVHFTKLLEDSKLDIGQLSALLTQMEVYGIIRKQAGNYYSMKQL